MYGFFSNSWYALGTMFFPIPYSMYAGHLISIKESFNIVTPPKINMSPEKGLF